MLNSVLMILPESSLLPIHNGTSLIFDVNISTDDTAVANDLPNMVLRNLHARDHLQVPEVQQHDCTGQN